ncbi:SNF7 family protein [Cavenderia fasciculata]|uniref:SNF7 family protein n=1 Tax=Cavenderia fasciculata TaxID=261658 RepID=F4Q6D7_CACFS|nr:SNF7 family protein [Cavenderia fasciculata]EGG16447.1 SNF7 family protein [Cavenderia fasciculata]|eukprot:XP_004354847.1 SNF7 family protein [Cavenderia fasciculata]
MKRFFGASKTPQGPTLDEATKRLDGSMGSIDDKIRKMDQEIAVYREQMKKCRQGTPAYNGIKNKAVRVLQQKKMYERQREQLMTQQFNMEQTKFVTQNMQDTITTVAAMKQGAKAMKQQFKHLDIDDIDNLQDDMQDMVDFSNEVQESLSRAYQTPDTLDESALEEELMSMDDELDMESTPSYLLAPSAPTSEPSLDEYGLPEPSAQHAVH